MTNELDAFIGKIDDIESDLDIKFSLTKSELDKELTLKNEIITTAKENLVKKLVEKNNEELKEEDLKKAKKRKLMSRKLHIKSVSVDFPKERSMTYGMKSGNLEVKTIEKKNKNEESKDSIDNIDDQKSSTESLLDSLNVQAKNINNIMKALKGLSDFKEDVKQQIGSISQNISKIKGKNTV
jgi:hypothetical protein